jgi:hypothetical protein
MNNIKVAMGLTALISTAVWAFIPPPDHGGLISYPASLLVWKPLPNSQGITYANVKGELLGVGPYEAFVRFPSGLDNPYHVHTLMLPTVVLQGTFYVTIDGKTTDYPPGSYFRLPANQKHFSGCKAGAGCLLFQSQTDNFDLKPVAP